MSEITHTPGPWAVKPMYGDNHGIFAGPGAESGDWGGWRGTSPRMIATTYDYGGVNTAISAANARLIAAAPDLLLALSNLVACEGTEGDRSVLIRRACEALAKARG
jgi:hypothetical protein